MPKLAMQHLVRPNLAVGRFARRALPLACAVALSGCQLFSPFRDPNGRANPDMAAVVNTYVQLGAKPVHQLTVAQARAQPTMQDAARAVMATQTIAAPAIQRSVAVRDLQVDGAAGPLAARLYSPASRASGEPILLYFHGGGFVTGNLDAADMAARALASQAHAKVLSVAYRLAPENRFPAAEDDAVASYRWLLGHAASLGADPRRIAVGGDMAGANLALNVAIAARDQHFAPPVHMLLIDPMAGTDMNTPSYIADENAVPLGRADMAWYFNNTIRSQADLADPRLDLIGKASMRNLPPATVISAEIDPLESDGRFITGQLRDAGNNVDRTEYGGTTHSFFDLGPVVARAALAETFAAQSLDTTFSQIGAPKTPREPHHAAHHPKRARHARRAHHPERTHGAKRERHSERAHRPERSHGAERRRRSTHR